MYGRHPEFPSVPLIACASILEKFGPNLYSAKPLRGVLVQSQLIQKRGASVTHKAHRDQSINAAPSAQSANESAPTLLVLGAGPKGVAIAAKRHMLAKLGYPVPNLHI